MLESNRTSASIGASATKLALSTGLTSISSAAASLAFTARCTARLAATAWSLAAATHSATTLAARAAYGTVSPWATSHQPSTA